MTKAQRYQRRVARQHGRAAIYWIRVATRPGRGVSDTYFEQAQRLAVQAARFAFRWARDSEERHAA